MGVFVQLAKFSITLPVICAVSLLACPFLSDFFLPYGQVGVGIPGGLEVAIHAVHHSLSQLGNDESVALLKINMKNTF